MGYIWSEIPKEYKPDPSKWKIEGTPFENVQKRLNAKGLHNPWLRNEVWVYSMSNTHYTLKNLFSRGLIPGFALFCGALAVEKMFFSKSNHDDEHH